MANRKVTYSNVFARDGQHFYGLIRQDFKALVYVNTKKNNLTYPQNWDKNQDCKNYFHEDPEIKAGFSEAEFSKAFNPDSEFLRVLKSALEYQGFDPKVILRQLLRNRNSFLKGERELKEWDLSNVSDDFAVKDDTAEINKFSNKGPLSKDIAFLIIMFLLRNKHISKIIKKLISGISEILEMLKEKYEIKDEVRASGTSLNSKDITLPRIAGVIIENPLLRALRVLMETVNDLLLISFPAFFSRTPTNESLS
ncbi:unnamed protein product, partial [Brenthis ino]